LNFFPRSRNERLFKRLASMRKYWHLMLGAVCIFATTTCRSILWTHVLGDGPTVEFKIHCACSGTPWAWTVDDSISNQDWHFWACIGANVLYRSYVHAQVLAFNAWRILHLQVLWTHVLGDWPTVEFKICCACLG